MTKKFALSIFALLAMASLAEAHPGHGTSGLLDGLMHPFTGFDHLVAMVAVGFFAATLGGRARLLVPGAFVAMMVAGAGWAMAGMALPFVEAGIFTSMIVLGGIAVLRWNAPLHIAMALCGFFAVFHGYAHGLEVPALASGITYSVGFVAATILLHGVGLAISFLTNSVMRQVA